MLEKMDLNKHNLKCKVFNRVLIVGSLALLPNTVLAGLPSGGFLETCEALNGIAEYSGPRPATTPIRSNFTDICNSVVTMSNTLDDDVPVSALRHEETAAQGSSTQSSTKKQQSNVQERLEEVRNETVAIPRRGYFINGTFRNTEGQQSATEQEFGDSVRAESQEQNFVQGERSFDADSQGFTVGTDYRLDNNKTVVGIAFGYEERDLSFTDQNKNTVDVNDKRISGGVDTQSTHFTAYVTHAINDTAYVDASVSIASSDIDTKRPVPMAREDGGGPADHYSTAKSSTESTSYSASLGAGRDINLDSTTLTPFARWDYSKIQIDPYTEETEKLADAMKLSMQEQNITSSVGTIGVRASRAIRTEKAVIVPQASVSLSREFSNDSRAIVATLPAAAGLDLTDPEAVVHTNNPDRNYAKLSAGVSAVLSQGQSAFVQVDSLQGHDYLDDTTFRLGYRIEF